MENPLFIKGYNCCYVLSKWKKFLLELSPSIDGSVSSKIYYENGQVMQVEDRDKNGRAVKVYDKAGNLIAENIFNKEHEIKQIY